MGTKFALMILCFAIALTVHELGHYLAGVAFKTKIKSFNIFAPLGFHLFSTHDKWFVRLFPSMSERVEIKIGWMPILAYVRFQDKPTDDNVDNGYLTNKPAWQRLIVYSAGVLMNFLLAVVINMVVFHHYVPQEKNIAKVAWMATVHTADMTADMASTFVGDMVDDVMNVLPFVDKEEKGIEEKPHENLQVNLKGGYYQMASRFPRGLHWMRLARILIVINISLFIFNLLPVPPLDGGQILFAVYECIIRRPPNQHFQILVTFIGMLLLLASMIYFLYDEIIKDLF